MKVNLDQYISTTIDVIIFGQELHVKQPSVSKVRKLASLAADITAEDVLSALAELGADLLNGNTEGVKFKAKQIEELPMPALEALVGIFTGRVAELEHDPN